MKENGGTHRCVAASITVKAPISEVWNVLTAYEALPEYALHDFYSLSSKESECLGGSLQCFYLYYFLPLYAIYV